MPKKLKLTKQFIDKLTNLPESGMGYQNVIVTLNNGRKLFDRKVVNSEFLLIDESENLESEDIVEIELK